VTANFPSSTFVLDLVAKIFPSGLQSCTESLCRQLAYYRWTSTNFSEITFDARLAVPSQFVVNGLNAVATLQGTINGTAGVPLSQRVNTVFSFQGQLSVFGFLDAAGVSVPSRLRRILGMRVSSPASYTINLTYLDSLLSVALEGTMPLSTGDELIFQLIFDPAAQTFLLSGKTDAGAASVLNWAGLSASADVSRVIHAAGAFSTTFFNISNVNGTISASFSTKIRQSGRGRIYVAATMDSASRTLAIAGSGGPASDLFSLLPLPGPITKMANAFQSSDFPFFSLLSTPNGYAVSLSVQFRSGNAIINVDFSYNSTGGFAVMGNTTTLPDFFDLVDVPLPLPSLRGWIDRSVSFESVGFSFFRASTGKKAVLEIAGAVIVSGQPFVLETSFVPGVGFRLPPGPRANANLVSLEGLSNERLNFRFIFQTSSSGADFLTSLSVPVSDPLRRVLSVPLSTPAQYAVDLTFVDGNFVVSLNAEYTLSSGRQLMIDVAVDPSKLFLSGSTNGGAAGVLDLARLNTSSDVQQVVDAAGASGTTSFSIRYINDIVSVSFSTSIQISRRGRIRVVAAMDTASRALAITGSGGPASDLFSLLPLPGPITKMANAFRNSDFPFFSLLSTSNGYAVSLSVQFPSGGATINVDFSYNSTGGFAVVGNCTSLPEVFDLVDLQMPDPLRDLIARAVSFDSVGFSFSRASAGEKVVLGIAGTVIVSGQPFVLETNFVPGVGFRLPLGPRPNANLFSLEGSFSDRLNVNFTFQTSSSGGDFLTSLGVPVPAPLRRALSVALSTPARYAVGLSYVNRTLGVFLNAEFTLSSGRQLKFEIVLDPSSSIFLLSGSTDGGAAAVLDLAGLNTSSDVKQVVEASGASGTTTLSIGYINGTISASFSTSIRISRGGRINVAAAMDSASRTLEITGSGGPVSDLFSLFPLPGPIAKMANAFHTLTIPSFSLLSTPTSSAVALSVQFRSGQATINVNFSYNTTGSFSVAGTCTSLPEVFDLVDLPLPDPLRNLIARAVSFDSVGFSISRASAGEKVVLGIAGTVIVSGQPFVLETNFVPGVGFRLPLGPRPNANLFSLEGSFSDRLNVNFTFQTSSSGGDFLTSLGVPVPAPLRRALSVALSTPARYAVGLSYVNRTLGVFLNAEFTLSSGRQLKFEIVLDPSSSIFLLSGSTDGGAAAVLDLAGLNTSSDVKQVVEASGASGTTTLSIGYINGTISASFSTSIRISRGGRINVAAAMDSASRTLEITGSGGPVSDLFSLFGNMPGPLDKIANAFRRTTIPSFSLISTPNSAALAVDVQFPVGSSNVNINFAYNSSGTFGVTGTCTSLPEIFDLVDIPFPAPLNNFFARVATFDSLGFSFSRASPRSQVKLTLFGTVIIQAQPFTLEASFTASPFGFRMISGPQGDAGLLPMLGNMNFFTIKSTFPFRSHTPRGRGYSLE
jgi:hypothetical protein